MQKTSYYPVTSHLPARKIKQKGMSHKTTGNSPQSSASYVPNDVARGNGIAFIFAFICDIR